LFRKNVISFDGIPRAKNFSTEVTVGGSFTDELCSLWVVAAVQESLLQFPLQLLGWG
jgi:hypothetical protein